MDQPRYVLRNHTQTLLYFISVILQPLDVTNDTSMPSYKRIDTHGKTISLKESIRDYEKSLRMLLSRVRENNGRPVVKKRFCRWNHELNKDTLDTLTLLDEQMMVLWNIATLHLCVGLLLYGGKTDQKGCGNHFSCAAIHYKWLSQINFSQGFLGYNTPNRFNAPKSAFCDAFCNFALSMRQIETVNIYMQDDNFSIKSPEDLYYAHMLANQSLVLAIGAGRDDAGAQVISILKNHKTDTWYWHDFFAASLHFYSPVSTGEEGDKHQSQALEYMYYVISYCGNIALINTMTALQTELINRTDNIKKKYILKLRIMAYNYILGKSPEIVKHEYQPTNFDIDTRNIIKSYID